MPLAIVALLIVRIVVANALASSGEKLRQTDATINILTEENELLVQHVASLSSLVAIEVRAKELGFIEPTKEQIITIAQDQFPFALK